VPGVFREKERQGSATATSIRLYIVAIAQRVLFENGLDEWG